MDEPVLMDCPFCGSDEIDHYGWLDGEGNQGPQCMGCGATAESVDLWNTRHNVMVDSVGDAIELLNRPVDTIAEMYCFGIGDCDDVRARLRNALQAQTGAGK